MQTRSFVILVPFKENLPFRGDLGDLGDLGLGDLGDLGSTSEMAKTISKKRVVMTFRFRFFRPFDFRYRLLYDSN